jgi:outer membrane protein TolC
MLSRAGIVRVLAAARRPWWALLLSLAVGCTHGDPLPPQVLAERILLPPEVQAASAASVLPPEAAPVPLPQGAVRLGPATAALPEPADNGQKTGEVEKTAGCTHPGPEALPQAVAECPVPGAPLTLPDAIALAFRFQPKLRVALEKIRQAEGGEDIAFAAFLPALTSAYSAGGFNVNAGGLTVQPQLPAAFNFIPGIGALPVGLDIHTGYELAELKLQWLVCDFGRRLGRYNQAGLATDIAQFQTQRAYQTVANDVATAFYQVLRTRSVRRIAGESVRRAEDDLEVARKLGKGGVVEREKVLRAEVALAQAQRALDVAEEAEAIAVAALNLAIGLNVSAPTCVADTADIPPFTLCLADCMQAAVNGRREFQVVRRSVQVAQQGTRVARADFAPRVVAEGSLLDYQQSNPRGHFDLALGSIKLEWGLFEGGKRVAELRVADSRIREAVAQAESIADTIAFQVNKAYHELVAARKGIDRSRPAVEQTRETYRLVLARARRGDAIPAEVTDAEAALTRAAQDYSNAVYDYQTALARLEYAMGTTPTPTTVGPHP